MYKIVFTHFDIHDGLGEWHTIVLEEKKKTFQTYEAALRYIQVEEKRNITKEYRRRFPAKEGGDPLYLDYKVYVNDKQRVTLDVQNLLTDEILERYEYLITKN